MTSGTVAFARPATTAHPAERAAQSSPRTRGARFVEFMLVGGATLVLFPLLWLLRKVVGTDTSEYAIGFLTFYGAYVINDPHFTVTYFLFYKDVRKRAFSSEFSRAHRARYLLAGVIVPAALVVWALVALTLHSAPALGWMIQLMFLLVGWHYVKQGFGVMTVLSARRGVRFLRRRAHRHPRCIALPVGPTRGRARPTRPARSRRRASSTKHSHTRAGSSSPPGQRSPRARSRSPECS